MLDDNEHHLLGGLHGVFKIMEWIVVGLSIGILVSIAISAWTEKPCPREEMGYKCRKDSGQKCECEE